MRNKVISVIKSLISVLFVGFVCENAHAAALPSGYTELEYLESTVAPSNAYIDTGRNFNSSYMYEITYSKGGANNGIMGARVSTSTAQGNFSLTYSSSQSAVYSSTSSGSSASKFGDTTYGVIHTVKYQQSTSTLLFDNTNKWLSAWITSVSIPYNVYLFGFNSAGSPAGSRTGYVRIYSYSVKDANGSLIQHFVPVKKTVNGTDVYGMYDLADPNPATAFYTNKGTGEFTGGPMACDGNVIVAQNQYNDLYQTYYNAYFKTQNNGRIITAYDGNSILVLKVQVGKSYTVKNTLTAMTSTMARFFYSDTLPQIGTFFPLEDTEEINGVSWQSGVVFTPKKQYVSFLVRGDSDSNKTFSQIASGIEITDAGQDVGGTYCIANIKIATRAYNTTQFAPVVSALNTAIDTIKDVVTNTINQTAAVSALQSTKQQRPADACPDYKQCLLVETEDGTPQWFVIADPFRDLFSPVIANNIAATGTTSQNAVPSTYTQLAYIESTGTQYIDTGVKLNQNSRVEIGWNYYTLSDISTSGRIFGARYTGVSNKKSFVLGTNSGKADPNTTMFLQYGNTSKTGPNVSIGTWLDIVFDKNVHTINGTQYGESFTDITFETPYTIKIFAIGQSAGSGETETVGAGVGRCSYFKIYNNGELVRDMIPAKRESDNVVGMYDLADPNPATAFHTNAGTGEFTAGPTVSNQNAAWTATFGANDTYGYGRSIVYGTATCNATSGSANDVATAVQIAAANWTATGSNCWCYAERVDETNSGVSGTSANRWVYLTVPSGETCATNCAENCANAVASGATADKPFRQALVGI